MTPTDLTKLFAVSLAALIIQGCLLGCATGAAGAPRSVDDQIKLIDKTTDVIQKSGARGWLMADLPTRVGLSTKTEVGSDGRIFGVISADPSEGAYRDMLLAMHHDYVALVDKVLAALAPKPTPTSQPTTQPVSND